MTTLTYCKGLPTPWAELNPAGNTEFECFLTAFSGVFYRATIATVNHLLSLNNTKFNKSGWNTYLQQTYGISKRHANKVAALRVRLSRGEPEKARGSRVVSIEYVCRSVRGSQSPSRLLRSL